MKRIETFLDKAPLWKVFIAGWFFSGLVFGLAFYILPSNRLVITGIVCIKAGATIGIIFGLMFYLMLSMMRKSQTFWEYAKVVETKVNEAKTKAEIDAIFSEEYQELIRKCQGGPQISKLEQIYTIIETKSKYLN